jgi:RNA polymerase sigma-32 factor
MSLPSNSCFAQTIGIRIAIAHKGSIAPDVPVFTHDISAVLSHPWGDISLNVPVTRDDASDEMQDWLVDPAPDPEALLAEVEDRNRTRTALKDALAHLTTRERHIISARFLAEQPMTLEDLGATFGVSRERIRQIEVRALQKIKSALRAYLEGTPPVHSRS